MPEDRRLAAIMFTDIVGYTALMGKDEDQAFKILAINREIHNAVLSRHNGTLIKEMGDGILASFTSNSDAVRCAIEIQQEAKSENIRLRIGIHEGEMVFEGSDVLGDGVNVASRLEELAEEGAINISGAVYKDIKNKAGIEAEFVEEKTLKNVDEPVKVYKVQVEEKEEVREVLPEKPQSKRPYYIISILVILVLAVTLIWFFLLRQQVIVKEDLDKSIAVLPFKNLSPDEENQYFADGVMDGILNHLSKIKDLKVVGRTSTEKYRETKLQIPEIGKELNVSYLLEASVFKSEEKIRVTAQLINAKKDVHLWSEQYDREWKDVFNVMSDISQQVASEIKAVITPETKEKIETPPTQNIEAFDLGMKGWNYLKMFQKSGNSGYLNNMFELFEQVIELDPNYTGGYSGLASYYSHKGIADSVLKYAEKIIELDPENADGYYKRAYYYWATVQPDLAISDFKKSIELVPPTHYVYLNLGQVYLLNKKDVRNGIKFIDKAFEVAKEKDPIIDPVMLANSGFAFTQIGEYERAEKYIKEALDWQVGCIGIRHLCRNFWMQGKFDMMLQFLDSTCQVMECYNVCNLMRFFLSVDTKNWDEAKNYYKLLDRNTAIVWSANLYWAYVLKKTGNPLEADSIAQNDLSISEKEVGRKGGNSFYKLAQIHAFLNQNEKALKYLREYERLERAFSYYNYILIDPLFENLRDDPEFLEIVNKAQIEKEEIREQVEKLEKEGLL
jgi:TolB-like protein/class 3 adenylate cyclase